LDHLVVVLVRTRNPLNLGAVARAMSNFGAAELRAVEPYGKAWREARSAVGAGEVLAGAKEFATIAAAVEDCSLVVGTTSVGNRELKHPLHDLTEAVPLLDERMRTGRVALLFGSEKWGLSNEELSYCHWLLRIPTREEHRSMNLGQAAAVVLYEMGRTGAQEVQSKGGEEPERNAEGHRTGSEEKKRRKALRENRIRSVEVEQGEGAGIKASAALRDLTAGKLAEMGVLERIGETLLEALVTSGYVGPRKTELAEEKLRRMLRRFSIQAADAEVFLGMMRKVVEKMKQRKDAAK